MYSVSIGLNLASSTKLNLYAALTHQTAEAAAAQIIEEFLAGVGEARIQHRIEKHLDVINELQAVQSAMHVNVQKIS